MLIEPEPKQTWRRMNFGEEILKGKSVRECSEIETGRDLIKPLEQLVCDVHEETHNRDRTELANLAGAQKRMVSMMARLAQSNDRLTNQMVILAYFIAFMTLIILIYTALMYHK